MLQFLHDKIWRAHLAENALIDRGNDNDDGHNMVIEYMPIEKAKSLISTMNIQNSAGLQST